MISANLIKALSSSVGHIESYNELHKKYAPFKLIFIEIFC
jgi:hypothetical protein